MWTTAWFERVLGSCAEELQSSLKASVSEYLDTLWKKSHLCGCDLRNALVQVAHIFVACSACGPVSDFVTCLVQVSEILYSEDSDRSPKQCLQLYNCAFVVHQLHSELFSESSVGTYFHALLVHCPVQHKLVCRMKKGSLRVLKPLPSALTVSQRTCCQVCWSVSGIREAWRLATLSRICIRQILGLPSLQASCLVIKVQSFLLTL